MLCIYRLHAVLQEGAINQAIGEAETISRRSQATADGLRMIAGAISANAGSEAVSMTVAQQYVEAFGKIAQKGNTMIVPADASNVASMVAQATSVFQNMAKTPRGTDGTGHDSGHEMGSADIGFRSAGEVRKRQDGADSGSARKGMSEVADSPILQRREPGMQSGTDAAAHNAGRSTAIPPLFSLQQGS